MAEIRIERKSGANWIWWLLGLAALAALAWWLLASRGDRLTTTSAGGEVATPMTFESTGGGEVTSLAMLTGTGSADLPGRAVALTNVPVHEVVSDRGFWVGDANARVFAIRTNQASPDTPPDGAVNQGQTVSLWGTVERMPTDLTQQETEWNLRATDASALGRQPVYVRTDSVRIVRR